MRHCIRRIRTRGTAGILLWTALVVMPSLALAGGRGGYDLGVRPPQVGTKTAPVSQATVTACRAQCQATATSLDMLRAQVQAAQTASDPGQMRAILAEVQQQQITMQQHLAMCTEILGSSRQGQ